MNRFRKAIRHCKKNINESPTNSMGGVYALNAPGFRVGDRDKELVFYPDSEGNFPSGIPGQAGSESYTRPEGFWSGGSEWDQTLVPDASQEFLINDPTGKDTSDLIAEDGTVKTFLPPDSRSFILGPLVDGYVYNHGNDNFTNIGYIQKDTRQFVLLARIQGQFIEGLHPQGGRVWDGTAEQLTIYNASFTFAMAEWFRDKILEGSFTNNVPYFYSGGVPQQPQTPAECPNCPPNMFGGVTPGTGGGFGSGGDPNIGTQQGSSTSGNQVATGGPFPGANPNKNKKYGDIAGYGLRPDGTSGYNKVGDIVPDQNGIPRKLVPRPGYGYNQWVPVKQAADGSNDTLVADFQPKFLKDRNKETLKETITPKQKKILREIKQPIKVKEGPTKYKMNFEGKYSSQNTPDKTASAQSDALVASGNDKGHRWRQSDKYWSGYETTERMNVIHDRVGHGKQAWDMILDEAKKKNGWRTKEIQEELNKIAHERAMLKENPDYTSPFGGVEISTTEKNKKNFDKVNKIKKIVNQDYSKNIKPEYPEEPAQKPNPSSLYKSLDPISADSMPDTGNPEIDKKVSKARKKAK
jgi:hypothetical protein